MPCVKRKLVALALFAITAFAPNVSFAASTVCECFCGEVGKGATDEGATTKEGCKETCSDKDTEYVGCFTDTTAYPVESDTCWTQEECAAWSAERNGVIIRAEWGDVFPADCAATKTSQEPMHYCYAKDVPYDLNIAIGSVGEVQNLPDYINLIYTWMLPAATLVAVVMMMIGGLQYTLSRGKPKYIEKAKTRITNAITGIVLLMSAYVILNLIDPRLVSFDALRIPLIKEVTILDPMSSCERLADVGYGIDPDPGATSHYCGEKGTVTSIDGLADNAIGSWKEGDSCNFQGCKSPGMVCVDYETSQQCASCAGNPTPTVATCGQFEQGNAIFSGEDQYVYCRYDPEGEHVTSSGSLDDGACIGIQNSGTSLSEQYLNCERARADAEYNFVELNGPEYPGCAYYETLEVTAYPFNDDVNTEQYAELLEEICTSDPCGLAADNGASRCQYDEGTEVEDYFFGLYTSVTPGFYCRTIR